MTNRTTISVNQLATTTTGSFKSPDEKGIQLTTNNVNFP